MVTIQEIVNDENDRYSTSEGEKFSNLAYLIEVYSKDTKTMQAPKAVRHMIYKINELLGGPKYRFKRSGDTSYFPFDNDTMRGVVIYKCLFDLDNNIIYKE